MELKIEVRLNRVSFRLSYVSAAAPKTQGYLSLFIQHFQDVQVTNPVVKSANGRRCFGKKNEISEDSVTKEMRQEVNLVFVYFSGCP